MKTKWFAAGAVLALAVGLIGAEASCAKPADLPSQNGIECPDGSHGPVQSKIEINLGFGSQGITLQWGAGAKPEKAPKIDALTPAFVEQWLSHVADMMARPDRFVSAEAIVGKLARVHVAAFGPAQADAAAKDKLRKKREAEALQKARATVDMRLFESVSLNLKNVPLQQAIRDLAQTTGLRITPDFAAIDKAGVKLNQPVSLNVDDATIHAALRQLLDPLKLTFETRNGVVLITIPQPNQIQSNADRKAQADAREAQRLFEIAERRRRASDFDMARRLFQQVHLLAPTTLHGRMAIMRIIEIEERMRDVSEEQGGDQPSRSDDSDQVFREIRERTVPLGLVKVSY